jgi:hypothetical protein
MHTNVNLAAPVGVLGFLGTGFVIFMAGLALVYSLIARKTNRRNYLAVAIAIIAVFYLGIILIFSLASSEKVLARGQEKHFCEIDCHLAYSVTDVDQTKTLGSAPNLTTATGMYYVVAIKTRFDETTISSTRGNGLLYPNSRAISITDERGQTYYPSDSGQRALEQTKSSTSFTTPLRPAESYTTTVIFDLPADVRNPILLINEADWNTHFIIGHENSPLHKKTRFQI